MISVDSKNRLIRILVQHEARRLETYLDSKGILTVGVGHNLEADPTFAGPAVDRMKKALREGRPTKFTNADVDAFLERDIARAVRDLDRAIPWWRTLDEVRQRVLIELCFNMGIGNSKRGLLSFVNTLPAFRRHDWERAARGLKFSAWATDVKAIRAGHVIRRVLTGREEP